MQGKHCGRILKGKKQTCRKLNSQLVKRWEYQLLHVYGRALLASINTCLVVDKEKGTGLVWKMAHKMPYQLCYCKSMNRWLPIDFQGDNNNYSSSIRILASEATLCKGNTRSSSGGRSWHNSKLRSRKTFYLRQYRSLAERYK